MYSFYNGVCFCIIYDLNSRNIGKNENFYVKPDFDEIKLVETSFKLKNWLHLESFFVSNDSSLNSNLIQTSHLLYLSRATSLVFGYVAI